MRAKRQREGKQIGQVTFLGPEIQQKRSISIKLKGRVGSVAQLQKQILVLQKKIINSYWVRV